MPLDLPAKGRPEGLTVSTVDTRSPLSVSLSSSFTQAARAGQLWADQRRDPIVKGKSPFNIEEIIVCP